MYSSSTLAVSPRRYTPYNTYLPPLPSTSTASTTTPSSEDTNTTKSLLHQKLHWKLYLACSLACVFIFYTTTYIPNNWEYFTSSRIANFAAKIPTDDFNLCQTKWRQYSCPELPGATFKTMHWTPFSYFDLKFFPGNVAFYLYLLTVPLCAIIINYCKPLSNFFARKLRVINLYEVIFAFNTKRMSYFSFKEIGWISLTTVAAYIFFHYWAFDHNYNGYYPAPISFVEDVSRTMGQVAVFFLSLLFFPVARNSPVLSLLGISWEAAIQYHRWLGVIFFIFSILHMIFVYAWYASVGLFPEELVTIPSKLPTGIDNFTVPMMQFVLWICIVTIGIMAFWEPFRRKYFDIFLFAHHFTYLVLVPVTFWHAAAAWEYMMPGVVVWFVDRCVRAYRSTQAVMLVTKDNDHHDEHAYTYSDIFNPQIAATINIDNAPLTSSCAAVPPTNGDTIFVKSSGNAIAAVKRGAAGDFIELRVRNTSLAYMPGQYAFINVAEVSLTEWHPFTIASPVHAVCPGEVVFYIKTMGKGTWTASLFDYVASSSSVPVTVSLDGPYGTPIDFTVYDNIVLVCGGVGMTPIKSIYESLYLSYLYDVGSSPSSCFVKRVQLLFTARDASLFTTMSECLSHVPLGPFTAKLFTDDPGDRDSNGHSDGSDKVSLIRKHLVIGRMKIEEEILAITSSASAGDGKTIVFVCGPEGLALECERVCYEHGFDFHTETFLL